MTDSLGSYWGRAFFLFVPNACNARCSFCYVRPVFTGKARLSDAALLKVRGLLQNMCSHGFEEVRITGGDPTVFANLPDLISILTELRLTYTLLTNGFNSKILSQCSDIQKPKKVTVSFHSFARYADIFGVEAKWTTGAESVGALVNDHVDVCVSSVVTADIANEQLQVLDYFYCMGVRDFKLIFPNLPGEVQRSEEAFTELANTLAHEKQHRWQGARIRMSDLAQQSCLLRYRGYLSFAMPSCEVYDCCINVGNQEAEKLSAVANLPIVLTKLRERGHRFADIPCQSHTGACPIALFTLQ